VHGVVLAAVNPDNTPHGYNWTFGFPMLLFIVVALILYALYSRPHRRVPGRPIQAPEGSRAPERGGATLTASAQSEDSAGALPTAEEPDDSAGASE
jgi:hypothetical protein